MFGNVFTKIEELKQIIKSAQDIPPTTSTMEMEKSAHHDLNEVLTRERILWRDKVKGKWLQKGDNNTTYFHLTTIAHRRSNRIHHLLDEKNHRISNSAVVGQMFTTYYTNLFSSYRPSFSENLQGLIENFVNNRLND